MTLYNHTLSSIATFAAVMLAVLWVAMLLIKISSRREDPLARRREEELEEMGAPWALAKVKRYSLLAGACLAGFFLLVAQNIVFALVGMAAAFIFASMYPGWVERRYLRMVEQGLCDCLDIWIRCLQAGMSLQQGIEAASSDMKGPIAREMGQIRKDIRVSDLDSALWRWCDRVKTADIRYVVVGVVSCRQAGGKMRDVVSNIAQSVRERMEMREKINALTSMGRTEAYIMAGMPVGIGTLMYLLEPTLIDKLFSTLIGIVGTLVAIGWESLGMYIIWKMVNIKL